MLNLLLLITRREKKSSEDSATKTINNVSPTTQSNNTEAIATSSGGDNDSNFKAESKHKRTSRVIIRNLSFYANEKHVKSAMEANFGPVLAVDLPLVPELPNSNESNETSKNKKKSKTEAAVPRHRGFAFVTFTNANAAKQAVERGSEIKIKNRLVAIDFSVSKMEHQKMMKEGQNLKEDEEEEDTEFESESEADDKSDNEEDLSKEDSAKDSDSDDEDDVEESSQTKDTIGSTITTFKAPEFDSTEAKRTLFLRNVPFDATRHDVFELFRKFGRVEAVYLVKDHQTGVFKGTAFVRFESIKGCAAAMEASGLSHDESQTDSAPESAQFVSSKNIAMGLGEGTLSGLTLKGRHILVDLAVDRTTASSLAIQRGADGKPIKKMVGKDRRNLYLKNEGRVSSAADSGDAKAASAKHGGMWEDLPPSDRTKRERAFADKSTKLRSPLFFINPNRISIRNLSKQINEAELKKLVFEALKAGLKDGLATPKDAVAHWRAGGDLAHNEVMRRATDPNLVTPPVDDKNMKQCVSSVFIDRDISSGKKTADAPSRGFGFVEFTHHTHALAVLRQLNNNPMYSAQYAAGGKHASEMAKQKRGKKTKKTTADPETGVEFSNEDGKILVPRLIVEFAVENKVKARQQAEKVAQKKANKIKQKLENSGNKDDDNVKERTKETKQSRGALQREKKRARKEACENSHKINIDVDTITKKQKLENKEEKPKEKKTKLAKPQKKRKIDKEEEVLEDMIRSYKSSFSKGRGEGNSSAANESLGEESKSDSPAKMSREKVVTKRWFE